MQQYIWVFAFWIIYVAAHLLFKLGSTSASRWAPCFIIGSSLGVACSFVLMKNHTLMNPNVAVAFCLGGGFLLAQVALAVVFRSTLSFAQCVGILAITVGMGLLAAGQASVQPTNALDSELAAPGEPTRSE